MSLYYNDKGQLKRPITPYFRYTQKERPTIEKKNPGLSFSQLSKVFAENWSKMSDAQKAPFVKDYEADKAAYKEAIANGAEAKPVKRKAQHTLDIKQRGMMATILATVEKMEGDVAVQKEQLKATNDSLKTIKKQAVRMMPADN